MTYKNKLQDRIISVLICISLIFSMVSATIVIGVAAPAETQGISDPSTIEQWEDYFPTDGNITTENAGGVWTDKSVFTSDTEISGKQFAIDGNNNFLVALSAIGSNMSITGQAAAPTDTVLVLDMSSSMSGNVGSLAKATNAALKALYDANKDNRVSIVTYSANNAESTKVFLPLDTYTATGDYLTSENNTLSVARGVKNSENRTVTGSVSLNRGTYIQGGIDKAIEVLKSRTTVTDRIPVVVLMTDGEPTIGSTDIANPNGDLGFGVGGVYGGNVYNFATQLSLAYMKQVAFKDEGLLLYTVGVGVDNSNSVLDILNPTATLRTDTLNSYWNTYNNAAVGSNVSIGGRSFNKPAGLDHDYVSKIDRNGTKVNGYFSASSNNLETELSSAFEAVVAEIVKSSVYSPTLIQSAGHELSGYVSFVDKIGSYMKVYDIKGIAHGNELFDGDRIAKTLYNDLAVSGGNLGAMPNQGEAGYVFVNSVATRLSISNEKAWELINNAWDNGQLAYNPTTGEYSDWFGWLSTSSGSYLGPWYEGMEIPVNAGYVNRSYIYLGTLDDTNMMYATVRIREKTVNGVLTGEQEVDFAIPASLLPTITYEVSLDEKNALESINVVKDTPIHLIYEVGIDSDINKFNVKDKVSAEYLAANTDADGNVLFYTNEWERNADADGNFTGYYKSNTYAYFRPAQRNDRYYYQNDSLVYSNTNGTVYNSTTVHPKDASESLYYYYTYYAREGSAYKTISEYHVIPKEVLSVAVSNGNGTYSINKGTIRSDYSGSTADVIVKSVNNTGTLDFSHEPFADSNSASWNDATHSHVVGITMANNGRYTLTPETGIRLSKTVASDVTVSEEDEPVFTFDIEYAGVAGELEAYAYRFVNGILSGDMETVTFTDGKATVTLKDGETLYIGGMTTGQVTVTERTDIKYTVDTVSVNDVLQDNGTANVALDPGDMVKVGFVNTSRTTGTYTVAKDIVHDLGADYQIPQNENTSFKVELTFSFNGKPLSGKYRVEHTDGSESEITLNGTENEKVEIFLHHNDQYTVYGLPEGAVVNAKEVLSENQKNFFVPSYYNGLSEVTVSSSDIASVIIVNDYTAKAVSPDISVSGTKTLTGNTYSGDFTFMLQKYKGTGAYTADSSWITLDTQTVSYSNAVGDTEFNFAYDWSNEIYTNVGTYIYRVHEMRPAVDGMVYDARIHTFQVNVTDTDMDGELEISTENGVTTNRSPQVAVASQASGAKWSVHADFENKYTSDHTVSTSIDVQKIVNNLSGSHYGTNLANFKFGLYDIDGVLIEELMTNSAGAVRFSKTYTAAEAGTYKYLLREIAPDPIPDGWSYDNSEIEFTVVVEQVPDSLNYRAVITTDATNAVVGSEGNSVEFTFTNTYDPTDANLDIAFVSKNYVSNSGVRELKDGEFKFAIYELADGTRSADPVAIGTNNADGKVVFEQTLSYDKVGGPYHYDIVEIKPQDAPDYISYDSTVYKMTVNVTDVAGVLKANAVVENMANNNVVFTNRYTVLPAEVTISGTKSITGRVLTDNDFQFVLTNTDTGEILYATNDVSGSNISSFTFPELTYHTAGTYTYTVTEYDPTKDIADYADGVTYDNTVYNVAVTVFDDGAGQLKAVYTVNGGNDPITFANSYDPKPVNASVSGTKVLFGRDILDSDEFTFELFDASYDTGADEWIKGDSKGSVKCLTDGSITFELEPITAAGNYRYIVTEKLGDAGGVEYDATEWRVLVAVTDDGIGNLDSVVYYANDIGLQDRMVFTNTYATSDGDTYISGKKVLENRELAEGEFTFNLYEADDDSFTVSNDALATAVNDASGEFSFKLDYTGEDIGKIFYYVLKEENGGLTLNGVTYSDSEYHITVAVEDNLDGSLKITKTVALNGSDTETVVFTNKYNTSETSAVVKGYKTLEGRELLDGDKFEFELYSADYTAEGDVWTKADKLQSVFNLADGTIEFESIDYGTAGTYRYIVTEKKDADIGGITYDESEWHVVVDVTDDGSGALAASVQYFKDAIAEETMVFTNTYTIADGDIALDGTKILDGRELKNGEFEFELYEAENDSFKLSADADALMTVNNDERGMFSFNLNYTMKDVGKTFCYVVKEADNGKHGVNYSDSEYHITVTVEDNYDGTMKISKSIVLGEKAVNSIEFTNVYKDSAAVNIEIVKRVENKGSVNISPEGFEFLLEKLGTNDAVKVTSDQDGKAYIALGFSESDIGNTYTYRLAEIAGDMENVTYSTSVYEFTVTVGVDSNDKLIASVVIGENTVETLKAEFVNIYDYTPPEQTEPPVISEPPEIPEPSVNPEPPEIPEPSVNPEPSVVPENIKAPQTGDSINIWLTLMLMSGGGIVCAVCFGRKKKEEVAK